MNFNYALIVVAFLIAGVLWATGFGEIGDIWDLESDWNPTPAGNPDGPWSFRSLNSVLNPYTSNIATMTGKPGYENAAEGGLFKGPMFVATPGMISYRQDMVRWTCQAPMDSPMAIKVSGWIYGIYSASTDMNWLLAKNGDTFTSGEVLNETVIYDLGAWTMMVSHGDQIDLVFTADSGNGTWLWFGFTIEQIEVPLPPAQIEGDINRDGVVNLGDVRELAGRWLSDDCVTPRWCEGADIDENTRVDFEDFSFISKNWLERIEILHDLGFVVVTPNGPYDGGDFGPGNSPTDTAGIQEAINYAKDNDKNVYISGGTYITNATIDIPYMGEGFILEARDIHLAYFCETGDAIVIDSQVNSWFNFGYLSSVLSQSGWLVRLKPEDTSASPDGSAALAACNKFNFNALVVRGAYDTNNPAAMEPRGSGLLLDASLGPIVHNEITISELNTATVGLHMKGRCDGNWIRSPFVHGCNTHLQVGDSGDPVRPCDNRIELSMYAASAPASIGARIFGERNIFNLNTYSTSPGNDIIFEPPSRDNIVYATNLAHGITNNATLSTNKVVYNQPVGFNILTPSFPSSGINVENRNVYTVAATIKSPGVVTNWILTDGQGVSQTVNAGLYAGQVIYLEPGDKIKFTHGGAAGWKWRAME